MKLVFSFAIMIITSLNTAGQSSINHQLQKKIEFMFAEDQKWRIESEKILNGEKTEYKENFINRQLAKTDSLNLVEAKSIIKRYGFPGYSLVGEGYSNDFWAIVQHCDDDIKFQKQVLLLLEKQVKRNNASGQNFALLQDRVLLSTGKKQIYGTQVRYNPATKTAKPLPTQDSANVDKRRKAVGLSPLNNYLKLFNKN